MVKTFLGVFLSILVLTGCESRECISSHYETRIVLENQFTGIGPNGQAQYQMRPVPKQVYVCDQYAETAS